MAKQRERQLSSGEPIQVGNYRVSTSNIQLVVPPTGDAYIEFTTTRAVARVSVPGMLFVDPDLEQEREKVAAYLMAAYPDDHMDKLRQWMLAMEDEHGETVWRYQFLYGDGDLNRELVDREVMSWWSQD